MSAVHVYRLGEAGDTEVAALAHLLPQVSSRAGPLTSERVAFVVTNPSTHIVVASLNGTIVGMALLLVCTTLAGQFGFVEEVAVDASVRRRHVATNLMLCLLTLAKELGLDFVELTSRPSREAANGLYQALGFERRETNVYRHRLEDVPAPT